MKKIALSLMTLGLLQSTAALATAPTPAFSGDCRTQRPDPHCRDPQPRV